MQTVMSARADGVMYFDPHRNVADALRRKSSIDIMSGVRPSLLVVCAAAALFVAVFTLGSPSPAPGAAPGAARVAAAASTQTR